MLQQCWHLHLHIKTPLGQSHGYVEGRSLTAGKARGCPRPARSGPLTGWPKLGVRG